jgi:hypothetical protein
MLIGFLGRKRVGKDTCADFLCNKYNFSKLSFATPIKDICRIIFGFDEEQLYGDSKENIDEYWKVSPRSMFQYIGTDIFRKDIQKMIPGIREDFWVKRLEKAYYNEIINNDLVVVADVRFQNEIDKIRELGGIVIKLEKDDKINDDYENFIDDLEGDYLVGNNGSIEELCLEVEKIFGLIKKIDFI